MIRMEYPSSRIVSSLLIMGPEKVVLDRRLTDYSPIGDCG